MPVTQASDTRIPHDAWIIICDGRKAMIAHNTGTSTNPSLRVSETLCASYNPSTSEQGNDRPGRTFQSVGARRSAIEMTDLHEQEERVFLIDAARRFAEIALHQHAKSLVLVAPPRALGILREHLSVAASDLVVAEIAKDLTKHPMADIERLLAPA
jgi:protein required for attachment to host cells